MPKYKVTAKVDLEYTVDAEDEEDAIREAVELFVGSSKYYLDTVDLLDWSATPTGGGEENA